MKLLANVYNEEDINLPVDGVILNLEDFSEIKGNISLEFVKTIKGSNKEIYLNLNKIIHNRELDKLKNFLNEIKDRQIDGILFGDLSLVKICQEKNIKIPLIWNQTHLVTNYQTGLFYEAKGIKGALLASELNLEEIIEFQKNTKLNIFINIFGYQPMFKSFRKVVSNYFDYIKEDKKENDYYIHEKINNEDYLINEDFGTNIFSSHALDGIEEMGSLINQGINNFVINMYHIENDKKEKIIKAYKNNNDQSRETLDGLNIPFDKGFFYKKQEYKVRDHE